MSGDKTDWYVVIKWRVSIRVTRRTPRGERLRSQKIVQAAVFGFKLLNYEVTVSDNMGWKNVGW